MKKSLFLYLFIIAVLMNVFTYMFYSKQAAFDAKRYTDMRTKFKDSITVMDNKLFDADYFSLEKNDNAQNYLVNQNIEKLIPYVKDQLMAFNDSAEGNPYTGQVTMGEQKFIINKIKLLNHRWIIANYSNGKLWGEVLLKYFINDDKSISFVIMDNQLYPNETF